ncbi:hypothetical protein U2F10_21220 [Leptothoe sp. EHU-05/26/07-4]
MSNFGIPIVALAEGKCSKKQKVKTALLHNNSAKKQSHAYTMVSTLAEIELSAATD